LFLQPGEKNGFIDVMSVTKAITQKTQTAIQHHIIKTEAKFMTLKITLL